jgi:hypothetical protein
VAGELCVAGGFFHWAALQGALPAVRGVLLLATLAALVVHVLEARSGRRARFAPFIGIAAVFALQLSGQSAQDPFGIVYGAFFVALLAGGGGGLLLGELLGRAFRPREQ